VISTALRRDQNGQQAERRRLVVAVELTDAQGRTRTERALIDSGAEENCVRQSLAVECGWSPTTEERAGLATLEGREVWTYGVHSIALQATDSVGETRAATHRFVACDFDGLDVNLILGYPWLAEVDPTIGYRAGTWRFPPEVAGVVVVNAEQFYEEERRQARFTPYCRGQRP
jgi:hypothetical protein